MTPSPHVTIFDGHNDMLQLLLNPEKSPDWSFFKSSATGHIDLPRAGAGGLGGGFFAVFAPSDEDEHVHPGAQLPEGENSYALPLAPPVENTKACSVAIKMIADLYKLEAAADGQFKVVDRVDRLQRCFEEGVMAAVLHFEGAEAIDPDLDALYVFHRAGLRSLGITWSRSNLFGQGVPFRFPHSPDVGPGLTEAGHRLVRACNSLGIIVDLSHLNAKGFWDVERISDKPLVATHAGVHALCPSTRNLTDRQLDAIAASGGIVGINFHVAFVRSDGHLNEDTPLVEIVRHIDYVVDRIGIDHVGFGSDFDGATMPLELGDAAGLPKLVQVLGDRGYDHAALEKIAYRNWFRVIGDTWRE